MKKLNIVIVLLIMLLISGCKNPKEMQFKTYEIDQQVESTDTSSIIYSYDLYLRFIEENNLEKEYDESYFDSNLLISVVIPDSNIKNYGKVKNYYISQNRLIIKIEYLDSYTNEEINSVLFLFEYNNTILTDVNTIQLETNKIYELPVNLDTEFDYCRGFLCNSRYNGKTFVINSYDKYIEFYKTEQLKYNDIEVLNEDYFMKKSLIVVRYNQELSSSTFDINTYFENGSLIINIDSTILENLDFDLGYLSLIQVDKVLLNSAKDIRVIKDNNEITNNIEIQNYGCYQQDTIFLDQHFGTYKIINSKEQLISSYDDESLINNYSDEFFMRNSLVVFKMVVPYNFRFCDMWYYINQDSLVINYQVLDEGQLSTYDYLGVVEVKKDLLSNVSDILIYTYLDNDNKVEITKNSDEIISYGIYNYSEYLCEFISDKLFVIDSFEYISEHNQSMYPKDIFDEKVILLYTFELKPDQMINKVDYEIIDGILYIYYSSELHYNQNKYNERYISIEIPIEIYNTIKDVEVKNLNNN